MMVRFKIDEEVIIKNQNRNLDSSGVVSFITIPRGATHPIYTIQRRLRCFPGGMGSVVALDNQQVCKYAREYPRFRIYKLGEV